MTSIENIATYLNKYIGFLQKRCHKNVKCPFALNKFYPSFYKQSCKEAPFDVLL